jgi:hypothetical protein
MKPAELLPQLQHEFRKLLAALGRLHFLSGFLCRSLRMKRFH